MQFELAVTNSVLCTCKNRRDRCFADLLCQHMSTTALSHAATAAGHAFCQPESYICRSGSLVLWRVWESITVA